MAGRIRPIDDEKALPAQLPYLKSGHVQLLLAQDCYGWGHKSVELLLEKIVNKKDPPDVRVIDPLTWRRNGILVTPQAVLMRTGRLWPKLTILPLARLQSVRPVITVAAA